MIRQRLIPIACLSCYLLLANKVDEETSPERRNEAAVRSSRIKAEALNDDAPDRAGEYCRGDFPGDHCHPPSLRLLLGPDPASF
jgi:hypothetical protein